MKFSSFCSFLSHFFQKTKNTTFGNFSNKNNKNRQTSILPTGFNFYPKSMIFFLNESLKSPLTYKSEPKCLNITIIDAFTKTYGKKNPKTQKQTKKDNFVQNGQKLSTVCLFAMKFQKIKILDNFEHFTYPGHLKRTSGSFSMPTLSYWTFFTGMLGKKKTKIKIFEKKMFFRLKSFFE